MAETSTNQIIFDSLSVEAPLGPQSFNGLLGFCWDRLPLNGHEVSLDRTPCLQEEWFLIDCVGHGSPFIWRGRDPQTSHKLLFKYARAVAWERGQYGTQPWWLMLHQMIELLPALLAAAGAVSLQQRSQTDG